MRKKKGIRRYNKRDKTERRRERGGKSTRLAKWGRGRETRRGNE